MKSKTILALLPILFSFFVMGFVDIVSISVSYVKSDFALSDYLSNLLPLAVFVWFGVCSIPIGLLMRRIGRKNTVLLSAVVTTLALLLPLFSYTFPVVFLAFALLGVGNTILQVSINPLVSNIVSPHQFTSTLTFGMFVKAICSATGPLLVAFAAATWGDWKLIFPLYAAITLLSLVWLWLTPMPREQARAEDAAGKGFGVVLALMKERPILLLWSVIVLVVGFEVGLMTAAPKFFLEKGFTLQEGGYANTLYFIARTTGTLLGTFLLAKVNLRYFSVITVGVGVLALSAFALLSDMTGLYAAIFVVGLVCANIFPITFAQAIQYKPEYTDEIASLMIVGVAGGALIPPLMGLLADGYTQQISLLIPIAALVYIFAVSLRKGTRL